MPEPLPSQPWLRPDCWSLLLGWDGRHRTLTLWCEVDEVARVFHDSPNSQVPPDVPSLQLVNPRGREVDASVVGVLREVEQLRALVPDSKEYPCAPRTKTWASARSRTSRARSASTGFARLAVAELLDRPLAELAALDLAEAISSRTAARVCASYTPGSTNSSFRKGNRV